MTAHMPLVLHENNDETVELTIVAVEPDDDLNGVTVVQFILKDNVCADDAAGLVLSSAVPAQLIILTHTASVITAEAYIPATALQGAYPRVYHVDGLDSAGHRRTAISGPVTVEAT
jgi:hypothetical protein